MGIANVAGEVMIEEVVRRVQRNCDISDANHGGNFTMCTYLMKMREYFRWEKGFAFTDRLPKDELGEWLASREDYWESIEREDFAPIEIDGDSIDPFDSERVNEALIYSERGLSPQVHQRRTRELRQAPFLSCGTRTGGRACRRLLHAHQRPGTGTRAELAACNVARGDHLHSP